MKDKLSHSSKQTRKIREKAVKINEEIVAVNEELKTAADQDKELIEKVSKQIEDLCEEHGLFCGMFLGVEDLTQITKLMFESKENVYIKFHLYFKDKEE